MTKIILPLLLIICFSHPIFSKEQHITLASTTSTENSGLLDYLLPFFTEKSGVAVRVLTRGTGQALELGRRGDVDVVFVHAETFEEDFLQALSLPGPVLIDVVVTEDENCYPMVAPGKSNAQMIGVFKRNVKTVSYITE